MKKIIVLLSVLIFVLSVPLSAKSKKSTVTKASTDSSDSSDSFANALSGKGVTDWANQTNLIELNPLDLIFGLVNVHYETAMGKTNGLGINVYDQWFGYPGWNFNTIGASCEYNWYFQKHALNGWFAGPSAGFQVVTFSYDYITTQSGTSFAVTIGGQGGYRWIWHNGFVVDCIVGIAYGIGGGAPTVAGTLATYTPIIPRWGANIGYAWK
jgi:hypothetical protein